MNDARCILAACGLLAATSSFAAPRIEVSHPAWGGKRASFLFDQENLGTRKGTMVYFHTRPSEQCFTSCCSVADLEMVLDAIRREDPESGARFTNGPIEALQIEVPRLPLAGDAVTATFRYGFVRNGDLMLGEARTFALTTGNVFHINAPKTSYQVRYRID